MKKIYLKSMMLVAMLLTSMTMSAFGVPIDPPSGDKLQDGKTYALFNWNVRSSWLGHTNWDGALYYAEADANNYVKFTAIDNLNGTWSFTEAGLDEVKYMVIPDGTDNLHCKILDECPDPETVPVFEVEDMGNNVYRFIVGDGNNYNPQGFRLHMNAGNQYIVANEPVNGGSWYPDFYGGPLYDEYGDPVYVDDESDLYVFADSTTCNWILVDVENIAEYIDKAQGYSALINFAKQYLTDDYAEWAEGFEGSYFAAVEKYNGAEFYEDDLADLQAILTGKINLYNRIQDAQNLNYEEGDPTVEAAIEDAIEAFNTKAAAADVANALAALNTAIENFLAGTGDITSLGTNMSFEDLSSQGGSQTSGIANPPTGWKVFINDKEVTSASEVSAAGITAWHGINDDCDGEGKDGTYGFGLWTGTVPKYEVSQTLTGLDNGTYTVTAGLMVGANGNGSRRTTQRIFGNLNSTYYASQEEYDEGLLDQSEVYAFQGNEELTTDRTLLPMEVKAYVYDGTLTFGVRTDNNIAAALRSSGNSAGGDGWFKVDNFRIKKEGFIKEDQEAILEYFLAKVEPYVDDPDVMIYPSIRTIAEGATEKARKSGATDAEVDEAIVALSSVAGDISKSAAKYEELLEAIYTAYENLEIYDLKPGAGEFGDSIMVVEERYGDNLYDSAEEIDAAIKMLEDQLDKCITSDVFEAGDDITDFIKNPSFENWQSTQSTDTTGSVENAPTGWKLNVNGTEVKTIAEINAAGISAWCAINVGDGIEVTFEDETYYNQPTDGEHLWGIWNDNIPDTEIYQELTLPQGVYELSCDMMVQYDWAGEGITTQRLFANNSIQMWADESLYGDNFTSDMKESQAMEAANADEEVHYFSYAGYDNYVSYDYTSLLRPMKVTFVVGEDGKARFGVRTNNVDRDGVAHAHAGAGWVKIDNFQLKCVSFREVEVPVVYADEDVNRDGSVNSLDVLKIYKYMQAH